MKKTIEQQKQIIQDAEKKLKIVRRTMIEQKSLTKILNDIRDSLIENRRREDKEWDRVSEKLNCISEIKGGEFCILDELKLKINKDNRSGRWEILNDLTELLEKERINLNEGDLLEFYKANISKIRKESDAAEKEARDRDKPSKEDLMWETWEEIWDALCLEDGDTHHQWLKIDRQTILLKELKSARIVVNKESILVMRMKSIEGRKLRQIEKIWEYSRPQTSSLQITH